MVAVAIPGIHGTSRTFLWWARRIGRRIVVVITWFAVIVVVYIILARVVTIEGIAGGYAKRLREPRAATKLKIALPLELAELFLLPRFENGACTGRIAAGCTAILECDFLLLLERGDPNIKVAANAVARIAKPLRKSLYPEPKKQNRKRLK
ncbi:MAG TPA: hypothetical protein VFL42_02045 [Terriglobales bacterium]|nr:hypothetical protein [Terriglobales bacterium]